MELKQISRIERLRSLLNRFPEREVQSFPISKRFAEELLRELEALQQDNDTLRRHLDSVQAMENEGGK